MKGDNNHLEAGKSLPVYIVVQTHTTNMQPTLKLHDGGVTTYCMEAHAYISQHAGNIVFDTPAAGADAYNLQCMTLCVRLLDGRDLIVIVIRVRWGAGDLEHWGI